MNQDGTDPDALRRDIGRTRGELGETVEALAAKTDVKARAEDAAGRAARQAKDKVREVRDDAAGVATAVGDRVRSGVASVRDIDLHDADVPAAVRRPVPLAVIASGAALAALVVYALRRRRP